MTIEYSQLDENCHIDNLIVTKGAEGCYIKILVSSTKSKCV